MSNAQHESSNENDDPSTTLSFYFFLGTVGLALLTGLWMLIQAALF